MSVGTGAFVEVGMHTLAAISGSWFTAAMVLGRWAVMKLRAAAREGERRRPLAVALALTAVPIAAAPLGLAGLFLWAAYM